jgi:FixJ family two-component response regulator
LSKLTKIFIIDDDVSVREAMESLIQSLGYDAETFSSAEAYLACGRIAEAACLIVDVQMPGMSGFDLHRRLVTDGYRLPVIFMSGYPAEAFGATAVEIGAIGFISKPIDVEQLLSFLNKALAPRV